MSGRTGWVKPSPGKWNLIRFVGPFSPNTGRMYLGSMIFGRYEVMNLDRWTLWPEESLASLSAMQGNDTARQMTVTSGRRLLPLCNAASPLGCFSRMLLGSSLWHSTRYKLTWQAHSTKARHLYFQLVPSAHLTRESASSLWPTPVALDNGSGRINRSASPNATDRPTLALMARKQMWPTPMASDSEHGGPNSRDSKGRWKLAGAVHHAWPTPTAQDAKNATLPLSQQYRATVPGTLARQALWRTPQAADHKSGRIQRGQTTNLTHQVGNALNPEWVEALMGLPIGWTALSGPPCRGKNHTNGNHRVPHENAAHTDDNALPH